MAIVHRLSTFFSTIKFLPETVIPELVAWYLQKRYAISSATSIFKISILSICPPPTHSILKIGNQFFPANGFQTLQHATTYKSHLRCKAEPGFGHRHYYRLLSTSFILASNTFLSSELSDPVCCAVAEKEIARATNKLIINAFVFISLYFLKFGFFILCKISVYLPNICFWFCA